MTTIKSLLLLSTLCFTALQNAAPAQPTAKRPDAKADPKIIKLTQCLQDLNGSKIGNPCKFLSWTCYVNLLAKIAGKSTNYTKALDKIKALSTATNTVVVGVQLNDLLDQLSDQARTVIKKEIDTMGFLELRNLLNTRLDLNPKAGPQSPLCGVIEKHLFGTELKDEL